MRLRVPTTVAVFAVLENEIDGQAFSELSEDDIRTMTQKLGIVKKIYHLKLVLQCLLCVAYTVYFDVLAWPLGSVTNWFIGVTV